MIKGASASFFAWWKLIEIIARKHFTQCNYFTIIYTYQRDRETTK